MEEYNEVLSRKKFRFSKRDIGYLLSFISTYGILTYPFPTNMILPDKKDLPFYETAVQHFSTYLITGNLKHFPEKSFIVTPREMLEIIQNNKS